jgi:uncharacterized repeat protein (TIGR01451 family)
MTLRIASALLVLLGSLPSNVAAQASILPPPPGTMTTVNNGPGEQADPHVSGNICTYIDWPGNNTFTIHYQDLSTSHPTDNVVPNNGTFDLLADVSGNTIAFTRVSIDKSAIFTYTIGAAAAVEVDPQPGSERESAQIGGNTVAWQDFGFSSSGSISDIVVYDIPSGVATRLTNDSTLNQQPALSPDGTTVAWVKCATPASPCDVWSATSSGSAWTVHQLTSGNGNCSHPDTNGDVVAYSCVRTVSGVTGDRPYWQPAVGGSESPLPLPAGYQGSEPSMAGHFIAFAGLAPGASAISHDIFLFDMANSALYQITNTPDDEQLSDIAVMPDGTVRVVWQVREADFNVYAFSFVAPTGADLAVTKTAPQYAVVGSNIPYTINVTNNGPSAAESVVITDTLPAGTTLVSCSTSSGSCGGTAAAPTISAASLATGATATATLNPSSVPSISITNPGSGYTSAPTVTITGGGGTGATATASLTGTGGIAAITVLNQGSGYTSAPTVTFTGGTGASLTATISAALSPSVPAGTVLSNTATITSSTPDPNTSNNSSTATVTVTADSASITNVIGQLLGAGCIDRSGIGTALTSKLAEAQADISAGNISTAINVLAAMEHQIQMAQNGKHIATTCTIGGATFNPVTVLVADVQSLINSLSVSIAANPITGTVVNSSGAGVPGVTLGILDSGNHSVATATTDITGFYLFATTSNLIVGATYTINLVGYMNSSAQFTWQGTAATFNFNVP